MPQEQEGAGRPARILLVGNELQCVVTVGEMLRAQWGEELVVSHTGSVAAATQELADHGATCVLVDLPADQPPAVTLEPLCAAAPLAPVLVLSDRPGEECEVAAVRAGAQDYLVKRELTAAVLGRAVRLAVERKRSESALARQALHDPLTSLPNRALFLDRLRVALDRSRRTGAAVVVMFLDVDGFKEINDSLGHSAGDTVLTVLADRFRRLLRPMDTVARFGGDEFTFLFEGLDSETEAGLVAGRISEAAGRPVALDDRHRPIPVSIGVAIVRDPEAELEEVVRRADVAMYRAKQRGGARFEIYEEPAARIAGRSSSLEPELRQALERAELRIHYQPRVSLTGDTGLVGFEALVRWEHPERGLLEPVQFLALAEETGLIVPLGHWVLDQALDQVRHWRRYRPGVTVSVNLSSRQLHDPELPRRLAAAIHDGGHDAGVLCLEISERSLAAEPQLAMRRLAALSEMGISIAVDDFGTSHASLAHLRQMPLHMLKVDTTLVARLGAPNQDAGVGAAVELGHALGLCVVAEGVETDSQLARLRELGYDGAQGFLFSQPMPEHSVEGLLGVR